MATNLGKKAKPTKTPPEAASFKAIRRRAKEMEDDTVRFLSELVRLGLSAAAPSVPSVRTVPPSEETSRRHQPRCPSPVTTGPMTARSSTNDNASWSRRGCGEGIPQPAGSLKRDRWIEAYSCIRHGPGL